MNYLTGFGKRMTEKYTNAQLSHVFICYFQNLWFNRTHFFEPVQTQYRLVLIQKCITNIDAFIYTIITYKHKLASSGHTFHENEIRGPILISKKLSSKLQICKVSFGVALLQSVMSLLNMALLCTEQILICKSTQLFQ